MRGVIGSQRVRALMRIAGEGREIARAGHDAREHVLQSLARTIDASVGVLCLGEINQSEWPRLSEVICWGWRTPAEERHVLEFYLQRPPSFDPLVDTVLSESGDLVTRHSREARACPMIDEELHRYASVDASLISIRRRPDGTTRLIVLKRARGQRPFDDEDCETVEVFRAENEALFESSPAPTTTENGWNLSPRERETLELLLTGQPEKLIAASMGLSVHTTHDHVKAVYRKLGVRSRAELMAMPSTRHLASRKTA